MILPHSYGLVLALTILTMLCWGSWANVLKIAKGWRFELLYYDYSIGVALGAALAGLTFGTWGSDGLRFADDLAHAGAVNLLCGFAGGVIYNLSNILVVGSRVGAWELTAIPSTRSGPCSTFASAPRMATQVACHQSSASCSTQPERR